MQPHAVVVLDVKASMQLERAVTRRGGIAVRARSGHAYIKRVVMGRNAVLGTEVSGHLFFGALNGIDDPLHAALLLTQWLVDGHGPLSARVDALPVFHLSPDLRLKIPAWDIDQLLASLPERFADAEIERIDGVRIVWPGRLDARPAVDHRAGADAALRRRRRAIAADDPATVHRRLPGVAGCGRERGGEPLTRSGRCAALRRSFSAPESRSSPTSAACTNGSAPSRADRQPKASNTGTCGLLAIVRPRAAPVCMTAIVAYKMAKLYGRSLQ
ncbi:MAG: hypothetical protein V9G12_17770 [Microthrixaceae bacterium]